jgi:hypothetical protein
MCETKKCEVVGRLIKWKCETCKSQCQSVLEKDGSHALLADCAKCLENMRKYPGSESSPVWLTCSSSRCPVGCNRAAE